MDCLPCLVIDSGKRISYGTDCTHCFFVDSQSYRLYMNWFDCPVIAQQGYSCYMDCLYCPITGQGHRLLCGLFALFCQ